MYIHSYDLSLSCVGVSIFTDDGKWVMTSSIETNPEDTHGVRLRYIGTEALKIRKKYPCSLLICEQGFSRFPASTQAIFKINGVIQYLYYDVDQIFLPATSVKKAITGRGNAKKEEVSEILQKNYPNISFKNNDESDSLAVGVSYLIKEGIIKQWKR